MSKGSHKVFKAFGNELLESLPIIGESGPEVSYFIQDFRKFVEVTGLSRDIRKPWMKATLKEIDNSINN